MTEHALMREELEEVVRERDALALHVAALEEDVCHLQANIAYLAPLTRDQENALAQTTFHRVPLRTLSDWERERYPPRDASLDDDVFRMDALNRHYYPDERELDKCAVARIVLYVDHARQCFTLWSYRMVNGVLNRESEIRVRQLMLRYCATAWPQYAGAMEPVRHLDGVGVV